MKPCHICLGPCDPVFHASSRRILRWLVGGSGDGAAGVGTEVEGSFLSRGTFMGFAAQWRS